MFKTATRIILTRCRLCSRRARPHIALLYAPPPSHLHSALQRFVPVGRARRLRSPLLRTEHQVRSRAGHGHRSLYHILPARLPGAGLPPLEHRISGPDLTRPGQSLHAHVRDAEHGWQLAEPQGRVCKPQLDPQAVLHEQGMHPDLPSSDHFHWTCLLTLHSGFFSPSAP